jgi:hypothetical protein
VSTTGQSMRERLAPMIRLLASEHDGEVLAAVAGMRRVLASKGYDMNDLATDFLKPRQGKPKVIVRSFKYRRRKSP